MTERLPRQNLTFASMSQGTGLMAIMNLIQKVVHVDQGDWIIVEPVDDLSLSVSGAFCEGIPAMTTLF